MSKVSDAEQSRRLQRLAALPDDQIDTSDLPIVEDWSRGVRGGTPRDVRRKAAEVEGDGDPQPAKEPSVKASRSGSAR